MPVKTLPPVLMALSLAACGDPSTASEQSGNGAVNAARATPAADRGSIPADPAAARIDFTTLAGRWEVKGVAVAGRGVQALATNDPAYMGQMLDIDADHLAWASAQAPTGATLSDRCDGPVTARQTGAAAGDYDAQFATQLAAFGIEKPDPHAVECDSGQWGPEPAGGAILFPAPGGRIAMSWYDGAMLLLEKHVPSK